VVSRLRPGLDESSVQDLINRVGLSPSSEIVTWFDGMTVQISMTQSATQPGSFPARSSSTSSASVTSTRTPDRDFDRVVADLPSGVLAASDLWDPSRFPLLRLEAGYVAVELADQSRTTSPVHVIWFGDEPEHRARVLWPSVDAFVVEMLHRFQTGIYSVDQAGVVQGPDVDAAR
jgi:hypothetical protein